jgi:DNA-directed RNA polymerase specialized sigma24 family protein
LEQDEQIFSKEERIEEFTIIYNDEKRFKKIEGIVSSFMKNRDIKTIDVKDAISNAAKLILGMQRKISKNYDFEQSFIFVIKNEILDDLKKKWRKHEVPINNVLREDADDEEIENFREDLVVDPTQMINLEKEEMKNYIYETMDKDTTALIVFEERCEGYSNKEIAEKWNIDVKEVEKALNRLKTAGKKFRSYN